MAESMSAQFFNWHFLDNQIDQVIPLKSLSYCWGSKLLLKLENLTQMIKDPSCVSHDSKTLLDVVAREIVLGLFVSQMLLVCCT